MGSTPVKGSYSASRIAAIIGLSNFQTPFHAWQLLSEELYPGFNAEKGYKLPEFEESAPLRWGTAFEDSICNLSEEKHGKRIIDREKLYSKQIGDVLLTTHIDGQYQGENILAENKTTNSRAFQSSRIEIKESLDDSGMLQEDFDIKKSWGKEESDEIPESYQVQCAVQRILTGCDLVRLNLLIFPKTQDEFEDEGWEISETNMVGNVLDMRVLKNKERNQIEGPLRWAKVFRDIGNFKTYNLPSHPELEKSIITAIQNFHTNYVLTGLPPQPQNYDDIRRLLTNPQGTIIADDNLRKLTIEYSEITRQLGDSGPMAKRKAELKVKIMAIAMQTKKDSWSSPPDKMVILNPDGGGQLASFSKSGFRSAKAK